MSKNKALPPIGDALKPAPALPNLGAVTAPATLAPDSTITDAARALGSALGASTALPAPASPRPMVRFSLELPKALDDQLRFAAIERDTNKTALIIQALAGAGFRVDDADLAPGKRRRR